MKTLINKTISRLKLKIKTNGPFVMLANGFFRRLFSAFTEQYFRGDGVTLNERFSAPQKAGVSEEEPEELTLNQRFSSNRFGARWRAGFYWFLWQSKLF